VNKRQSINSLIIMSLIVCLSACGSSQKSLETIVVADASQPVFALVYIASSMGYFKEVGLSVKFLHYTSGRDALNAVDNGKADVATVYETPVVLQTLNGKKLVVVSGLHRSNKNTPLVALKSRGIYKPTDLKGKRIGVTFNANAEFFLFLYLEGIGIAKNEITPINIRPEKLLVAMKKGEIDAMAVWNPHVYYAKKAFPKSKIVTFESDVYSEMSMMVAKKSFVKGHSSKIYKLVSALVKAERLFKYNNKKARQVVIQHFSNKKSILVKETWSLFKADTSLSNVMVNILNMEGKWYSKNKRKVSIDFRSIIDESFLKRLSPDSVTLN